ncbi:MAG: hypothetical protein E6J34_13470 [Chloroflexi bacterium]|nr:MAG: hypothetical protein E6J34_13470 [Chloroflexota bacterium]
MAKLQDMFTRARRAQSVGGIGFLGKGKSESKAHFAAIVVKFPRVTAGSAEAALKAGADGLLFTWDGKDANKLVGLKQEITSVRATNEDVVCGLHITGGWHTLDSDGLTHIKDHGMQYIILPLDAPARLLALDAKEVEKVITVPMRSGDMYPLFIRNLATLDGIAAALLDFNLTDALATLTIEELLHYHTVREAVRYPAFINVRSGLREVDAHTLKTLGVQAVILTASDSEEATRQQIKELRECLQKVHEEDKELPHPSIRKA